MSKQLIIGLIVFGVFAFSLAMYIVFSLLQKNKEWFNLNPLITFTANELSERHEFYIDKVGKYVFCITVKRDLKLVRPALYKINFQISKENSKLVPLKTGLTVFKEINGMTFKEKNYVLAEFEISKPGQYYVLINGDKGVYPTDKFFIRPKLNFF